MHLDKLELLGFKSFPEKTTLQFSPGISCIVGPNGCGKTNILDALRWVLGETRMSILRGGKLEEVIFSGTRDIKPLGMAEVNLTIQNDKGVLTSAYNQVTITRRLYRSGDSEYLINKTPCRRKDITEMFFDTGLTSGTYSVIEQDMIDIILSDKAEDRRHFFEEASGITKYKQRKKESLRKLESTEADLLRLADLYNEVSTQASALKRQVAKARRHKTLTDDINQLGIELAIDRWGKIEESISKLSTERTALARQLDDYKSREKILDLERENVKLEVAEKETAIKSKREKLTELTQQLHELETQISVLNEKSENTVNRHYQTSQEIDALESKQDSLEGEIKTCLEEIDGYQTQADDLKKVVDEGENKLNELTEKVRSLNSQHDELTARIRTLSQELNKSQESQITLDLQYNTSLEKIEDIKQAIETANSELESLLPERDELKAKKDSLTQNLNQLESERQNNLEKLRQLKDSLQTLQADLESRTAEYHQLKAEIELAGQIINQYEGYTSGAAQLGHVKDRFTGLIDTIANLINPDPQYTNCVQTVLGELSNYFVVDSKQTAREIIAYGRENKLGRFGLFILENIPESADPSVTFTNNPNIKGQLADFVSADPQYDRLVKYLFKDILVAEQIFDESGFQNFDLVSVEGEMIDFNKILTVGGTEEILLVGRKARLDEQIAVHDNLKNEIENLNNQISATREEQTRIDNYLTETTEQSTRLKEELAVVSANLSQISLKENALNTQLGEKRQVLTQIEQKLEQIDSEKAGLGELLNNRKTSLQESEQRVAAIKQELDQAIREKDEFSRDLSTQKMKYFTAESSLKTARTNHQRLLELRDDIVQTGEEKRVLISELLRTAAQIRSDKANFEYDLNDSFEKRDQFSEILLEAEGEITEIASKITGYDKQLKQLRIEIDEVSERIHEIGLKSGSSNSQKDTLYQETLEKYDFDLSSQSRSIKLEDEDRSTKLDQLADLKNKLDSLGPVNLLALEEYDQTQSRADFLKNQIEDLEKAKEDLRQTISRINSTARKKFLETFDIVKTNFQNVFCELFQGGEASLRLEENVDPLEAIIHISARPRGKKLLSIHQLSGGERALTATALLFSFYMVKPSPFCILDEVDAPLDDANIGRFLKLIKRFTTNTQFIIITHNKLTMEQAETLYGITMKKPGVSQIVSVNLARMGEKLKPTRFELDQPDESEDDSTADENEIPAESSETVNDPEVEVNQ